MALHDGAVGANGLVGVGRADDRQIGDGAQGSQVLDWLVGGAILANTHAVVGEDVQGRQVHERAQAHRRPHVVAEDHEGGRIRPADAAV